MKVVASLALLGALSPLALASLEDFPGTGNELQTVLLNDSWGYNFVSYEISDGLAIVDGDVIYGTQAEFESKIVKDYKVLNISDYPTNPEQPQARSNSVRFGKRSNSLFENESGLWPSGKVRFKFATPDAKKQLGSDVTTAINRWKAKASCLSFTEEKISDKWSWDVVTIEVASGICRTSQAGRGGDMRMMLDPACGAAAVTHEFGHALGLHHEQRRFDREANTHFQCDNLRDAPYSVPWWVPGSSFFTKDQVKAWCCGAIAWIEVGPWQINSPTCCGNACQVSTTPFSPLNSFTPPQPYFALQPANRISF